MTDESSSMDEKPDTMLHANRAGMKKLLRFRYGDQPMQVVYCDKWSGEEVLPENVDALLDRVGDQRCYFHVADLKDSWADPTSHKTGRVTSASNEHADGAGFIAFDVDARKYVMSGNPTRDQWQSSQHYAHENERIATVLDAAWERMGIKPDAIWHSGGGVQGLFWLDRRIGNDEASNLTMRLFQALGGDPNLAKPCQALRVPGSVNPKTSDGRTPTVTRLWRADDTTTSVEELVAGLDRAEGAPDAERAAGAPVSDLDIDPRCAGLSDRGKAIIREGYIKGETPQHKKDPTTRGAWLWDACWEMAEAGMANDDMLAILKDQRYNLTKKTKKKHGGVENAVSAAHRIVAETKKRKEAKVVARGLIAWRDFKNKFGEPAPSLANAVLAIKALGIGCRFDLFHGKALVDYNGESSSIQNLVGELTDNTLGAIRSLINNTYRLDPGDPMVFAAVMEIARDHAFNPVTEYLEECECKYDGQTRIDTWLIDYCGAIDTPFVRAIGRKHLIASVRRPRRPGVKYDDIIVLESPEGKNKSSAIELLAGSDNFSDQTILGQADKEVQENVEGVWLYEIADLTDIAKADVNRVKAFASRHTDRARRAYGRVRANIPRQCTMWATTNDQQYLKSQTGNRRFLPVAVGRIDLDGLRRDRDMLWGEAAAAETAGESIMLPESLWASAAEEQELRRIGDPWEDILADIPDTIETGDPKNSLRIIWRDSARDTAGNFREDERVSSADLLTHVLGIRKADQSAAHGQRLALIMMRLGWERSKSGTLQIDGKSVRGYRRPIQYFQCGPAQRRLPLGDGAQTP